MNKKLTQKQKKALNILKEHPNITARAFGQFYFDQPEHEYLFDASSNQGYGACRGKKLWLCAGSLLGKLRQKKWVDMNFARDGHCRFHLTAEGYDILKKNENVTEPPKTA